MFFLFLVALLDRILSQLCVTSMFAQLRLFLMDSFEQKFLIVMKSNLSVSYFMVVLLSCLRHCHQRQGQKALSRAPSRGVLVFVTLPAPLVCRPPQVTLCVCRRVRATVPTFHTDSPSRRHRRLKGFVCPRSSGFFHRVCELWFLRIRFDGLRTSCFQFSGGFLQS